jgi:hypothetical protein
MATPAKKTPKAPSAPRTRKAVAAAAPAAPEAKPAKAAKSGDAAKAPKADKPKKPKLVRDSFTIPKNEYAVLEELKLRAAKLGRPAKKSEVLRAGVQALAAMGDAAFLATVGAVPAIKTGRPAKA